MSLLHFDELFSILAHDEAFYGFHTLQDFPMRVLNDYFASQSILSFQQDFLVSERL